jgi:integrase
MGATVSEQGKPQRAKTRGNGEGSVYVTTKPAKGADAQPTTRWVAQVKSADGSKRRTFHATEAKAKKALRQMLAEVDAGRTLTDGSLTVSELLDAFTDKALPGRKLTPATLAAYRHSFAVLGAELGSVRVKALDVDTIEAALARLANPAHAPKRQRKAQQAQRRTSDDGLSHATLVQLRSRLSIVLTWAMRRRIVSWNAAALAELPVDARRKREGRSLTDAQVDELLVAAQGSPLEAMWVTMLYLGLRPGEAAGLTWADVEFDAGVVHVRRQRTHVEGVTTITDTLKTEASVRSLRAPAEVLDALKAHRKRQAEAQLAAVEWSDPHDLVFTTSVGSPWNPSNVRREFRRVAVAAGLGDDWHPHELRHSCGSLLSARGVPLEVIADVLGHRDSRMLQRTYRHRVTATVEAAALLGGAFTGSAEG